MELLAGIVEEIFAFLRAADQDKPPIHTNLFIIQHYLRGLCSRIPDCVLIHADGMEMLGVSG